jgi:hypothetical protein
MDDDALSIRQFGPKPRRRIGLNFEERGSLEAGQPRVVRTGKGGGSGLGMLPGIVLDRKTPRPVGTTGAVFPFSPACRNIPVSAPPAIPARWGSTRD